MQNGIDLHPFCHQQHFIPPDEFSNYLWNRPRLELVENRKDKECVNSVTEIPLIIGTNAGISTIKKLNLFKNSHKAPILICAESNGRKTLLTNATRQDIEPTRKKTGVLSLKTKLISE